MNNLEKYIKIVMESLNQDDMSVFKDWLIDNLYKRGYEDYSGFPDDMPGQTIYEWILRKNYNSQLFVIVYTGFSVTPPYNFYEREAVGVGIVYHNDLTNDLTKYVSFKPKKYENLSEFIRNFEYELTKREYIAEQENKTK